MLVAPIGEAVEDPAVISDAVACMPFTSAIGVSAAAAAAAALAACITAAALILLPPGDEPICAAICDEICFVSSTVVTVPAGDRHWLADALERKATSSFTTSSECLIAASPPEQSI